MTVFTQHYPQTSSVKSLSLLQMVLKWLKLQEFKMQVNNERRQLLDMTDSMLNDIGVSRAEAEREALRADLPLTRLEKLERDQL